MVHVHQTVPGNVVAGVGAKGTWGTTKFGGGYTTVRVERGTHCTHYTCTSAMFLKITTLAWASMLV